MKPLVTMIVPVRNRADLLDGVIGGVRQSWRIGIPFDLIVVDNGSTDNAPARIRTELLPFVPDGCKASMIREERPGASVARNSGLALANTPFVMFFDSDDSFTAPHMQRVHDALLRYGEDADLITWNVAFSDGTPMVATPPRASLRHHLFHASLSSLRWCASRELMERVGRWNENLPAWNDYELGVRLLLGSQRSVKVDGEPFVFVNRVADSITGLSITDKAAERSDALDLIETDLRNAGRKDLVKYVNARRAILAADCRRCGKIDLSDQIMATAYRSLDGGVYRRIIIRMVYSVQRLLGRGGSPLAELFL